MVHPRYASQAVLRYTILWELNLSLQCWYFLAVFLFSAIFRSSRPEVFRKKVFLEISQNSQENARPACKFIKKETLAQMFSCEFYKISKNTFFYRTPLVAASVFSIFSFTIPICFFKCIIS